MQKRLTLVAAAILLALIGLLPVLMMVANSFFVDGVFSLKAYRALLASGRQQWVLMGHSLLLSSGVAFFATMVGVPLGVLLAKTDLPFRRTLTPWVRRSRVRRRATPCVRLVAAIPTTP